LAGRVTHLACVLRCLLIAVAAPAIMLAAIFGALAAMPLAPSVYFTNLNLGLFAIIALSSMTTIGVVMAGWASNSKWALFGAMREAAQVIAYEIPLGISLLVPLMVVGTFHLGEASAQQARYERAIRHGQDEIVKLHSYCSQAKSAFEDALAALQKEKMENAQNKRRVEDLEKLLNAARLVKAKEGQTILPLR